MTSLSPRERRSLVVTLIIGTLMAALDTSIVNVSLPTMMRAFHAELDDIEWVFSAYLIGFALVMPLTHWLVARMGYFRLYVSSLAVFTVGSALCGLAPTLETLIAARVIQALGGGALTPTAMAVLSEIYEPHERGRVLGLWGLGVVLGPALGPTLGGLLTETFGWPSIFLVNLPLGALGLVLAFGPLRRLPRSPHPAGPLDLAGFLGLTVFLVGLLYGLASLEERGIDSPVVWGCLGVSLLALAAFVRWEKRHPHPLLDFRLFRSRELVAALAVTFSRSAALFGGVFLLPFQLQNLMGFGEAESGMLMIPGAALVAPLMPFAGTWADRRGPRGISIAGLVCLALSFLYFSVLGAKSGAAAVLAAMSLRGVGLGLLITPVSVATVNAVERRHVPLASSLSSLVQQVGGALGVAIVAVMHQLLYHHRADRYGSVLAEQTALRACFLLLAGAALVAVVPALRIPGSPVLRKNPDVPLVME